jgi:serine/threonine protein kinase
MLRVAGALKWLAEHVTQICSEIGPQEIWHLDLHLGNILVCGDPKIFKIGDFGEALRRQDRISKLRFGSTRGKKLTGPFSAPESEPGQTSDVWSFGCILLLILVFNYEGVGGLDEFMASLLRHANVDYFYERTTGKVNQETMSCIEHLRRRIANEPDRLVTNGLLDMLQQDILVPVRRRKSIAQVEATIVGCLNNQMRVERQIKKGKEFHRCGHSPGARYEVFHHDRESYTMSVWIWHQGVATELPLLEPISLPRPTKKMSRMERIYTRSSCCSEQYVCQVLSNSNPVEVSTTCSIALRGSVGY